MINPDRKISYLGAVVLISCGLMLALGLGTRSIRFWPTDSYIPYRPAAAQALRLPHFSQIHQLAGEKRLDRLNMRGKETLILGIALMQKALHDTGSLYPNILLLVLAAGGSGILFYLLFSAWFDGPTGLLAFALFISTFWPYLYVLQGAHQPLVLFFFLLTVVLLEKARSRPWLLYPAGLAGGFMIFASPTAAIYVPYFLLLPLLRPPSFRGPVLPRRALVLGLLFLLGLLGPILYFTLPAPLYNLKRFLLFILTSEKNNHFQGYFSQLVGIFPSPYPVRGGGWIWILRYMFLIMPVMFAVYLAAAAGQLKKSFADKKLLVFLLISLSTPVAVEISQVAQFGRNYFSWLFGIIFLLCFTAYRQRIFSRRPWAAATILLLTVHLVLNLFIFCTDIFPARMGTARLYAWLKKHDVHRLLIYRDDPANLFTAGILDEPPDRFKIRLYTIRHLSDARGGYVLLPPAEPLTIFDNCIKQPVAVDPQLQRLRRLGLLHKYVAASFPTLASSRIWRQEEEVCTYRDLMLGEFRHAGPDAGNVMVLDTARIPRPRQP